MLILTRRLGETIMVGHEITITVFGVRDNQVRIGVQAPEEIPVHREEVYDRIQRADRAAPHPNEERAPRVTVRSRRLR